MKHQKFIKLFSLVAILLSLAMSFAACSSNEKTENQGSVNQSYEETKNPVNRPGISNNRLTPDLSDIEVPEASKAVTNTDTIEKFVQALKKFVNPNGNEYDALSVIGDFRYDEEGDALLERLKTASRSWHEPVEKDVGEKCIVDIKLNESKKYKLSDEAVVEWNMANGKEAQDYARISCTISTNYAKGTITYTFDIVKLDGKWLFSTVGTLNKIQSLLITDIYR